jgi:tetratricopeptide (TPR) repeat protein
MFAGLTARFVKLRLSFEHNERMASPMPARVVGILVFLALLPIAVAAQATTRDIEKEKEIWTRIEAQAPDALEDFKAATTALDAGNFEEAARLYESVRKRAPNSDDVMRRLGTSLTSQGRVEDGLKFLEQGAQKNRSPENLISLAQSLAYPSEGKEGSREQKLRAFSLAKEANRLPKTGDDSYYQLLLAQLALDLEQMDEFRRLTEQIVARHPELMASHYFNAILAANDEKWITAENEMKQAESMGLPHEVAQRFYDSGIHARTTVWHYAIYALYLVGAWLSGLGLLFLVGKVMSRKTLRSIESTDPTGGASSGAVSLRRWYRALINLAGFYYYISMPVVIFLVLAVAASITYGFFMLGRIPIKLVAIICIGALLTVYKMIRSLFIKIESEDPGRSLKHEEAPGLWDLTRAVAEAVGTRPIDEIRITPGTDLAVYEKGSFRERSQDRAQRILIVGVGVLNDFPQNGFRAVLAHEYGHFSHRDTAGGDIALRVNADMMKFAHAMILSGQAVWWNIAFQFLRVYHFIFRRISHGATRLQEVLADRVAALKYGSGAFEAGLKHVVRKSVEFNHVASQEINESASSQRALQNLYELQPVNNADLEKEIEESLNRETTEDDTHPSPSDRFRFTRRIVSSSEQSVTGQVWDLFKDKEALTLEMTNLVQYEMQGG